MSFWCMVLCFVWQRENPSPNVLSGYWVKNISSLSCNGLLGPFVLSSFNLFAPLESRCMMIKESHMIL